MHRSEATYGPAWRCEHPGCRVKDVLFGPPADAGSVCSCGRAAEAKCQCGGNFCARCWWTHSHTGAFV